MTASRAAPTWIALLRAVNVGRANRIKMADLRACLEGLGYRDVRTYVQSGNAVFAASADSAGAIASAIHERLLAEAGIDVGAVVVSADEFAAILRDNPLLAGAASADDNALYAFVLDAPVDSARFDELRPPAQPGERAVLLGRAIYLELPGGVGNSKLTNAWFERALGRVATARNWRTMAALAELAGGEAAVEPANPGVGAPKRRSSS